MTLSWDGQVILDKAIELVQKQPSAICLDFQSMVDMVFVQVVPVLLLLWHTWQAHYVSGRPKNLCFPETDTHRGPLDLYFCSPGPFPKVQAS